MKFIKTLTFLLFLFAQGYKAQVSVYAKVDHLVPDGLDTLGNITLTVSGSTSPYTYTWNPGAIFNKDISNVNADRYTLNVKSANNQTYTNKYSIGYKVDWTNLDRCWFRNDSLVSSTGSSTLHCQAISRNSLAANVDGWVEYVVDVLPTKNGFVGFTDSVSAITNIYTDIDYGFYFVASGNRIFYLESTTTGTLVPSVRIGDVLRLERIGDVINYKVNGTTIRTRTVSGISSKIFKLKAALTDGVKLLNMGCSFLPLTNISFPNYIPVQTLITHLSNTGSNDGSIKIIPDLVSTYTYIWEPSGATTNSITGQALGQYKVNIKDTENVVSTRYCNVGYKVEWNNLNSCFFRNDSLVSITGSPSIFSNAVSKNTLDTLTDGWFEYVLDFLPTKNGFVGFTDSISSGTNLYTDIDFGFYFVATGNRIFYLEGSNSGALVLYPKKGDVLRLERVNNTINYKLNGVIIRTQNISNLSFKRFKLKAALTNGLSLTNLGCSFNQEGNGYFANYINAYSEVKHATGLGTNDASINAITQLSGSYTYTWQPSSSNTNPAIGLDAGIHRVNIEDSNNNISSEWFNVGYKVNWTNMNQCTFRNDSLVSTTGLYYQYCKAVSKNTLPANTDGWFEFALNALPTKLGYIGFLDSININAGSHSDIDYGIYLYSDGGRIGWYENGAFQWLTTTCSIGDIIRIERIGNTINYKINGVVKRTVTSTAIGQKNYKLKAALTNGIRIINLGCSFINGSNTVFPGYVEVRPKIVRSSGVGINDGKIEISKDFFGLKDYVWEPTASNTATLSNLVNGSYSVTVSDSSNNTSKYSYDIGYKTKWKNFSNCFLRNDTLKGTGANGIWGYACTKNVLASNEDGWFEYVITKLNGGSSAQFIGFVDTAANNPSINTDIQYGFYYYAAAKTLNFFESSQSANNILIRTPTVGDVVRIERTGNTINYKVNGIIVRTITNTNIGAKVFKLKMRLYMTDYYTHVGASFTPCNYTVNAGANKILVSPSQSLTLSGSTNAPAGSSYSWSPNGSSPSTFSTSVSSPGIYTLVVTNSVSGCYNYDTVQVSSNYLNVTALKQHVTSDNPYSGIISVTANGGKAPYSYQWSDNLENLNLRTQLLPGEYNVTIKDSLNDSLMVPVYVGVQNNWRMIKDVSITDNIYTRTNASPDSVGILVSHNYVPSDTSGWAELTVIDKIQTFVFGFVGFNSTETNTNYSVPYVTDEKLFSAYPYIDSIVNRKFPLGGGTPSILSSKNFDAIHLIELSDGYINVRFKGYTNTLPITYKVGDIFRIRRGGDGIIKLYQNNVLVASENFYTKSQHLLNVMFVKSNSATISSYGTLASTGNLSFASTPNQTCNEPNLNWVLSKTFDEYGAMKSESKIYMDMLGRTLQSQSKLLSTANVLVSEPIYDGFGRAVGQSLPAPSFNSNFCYISNFIEIAPNSSYAHPYFDNPIGVPAPGEGTATDEFNAPGDINHPMPVYNGTMGKLGWYYSNNNSSEPLVDADVYPYSRVEYYNDPLSRPHRASGVGQNHYMGSNHETKYFYTSTPSTSQPDLPNELEFVFPYRTYELEKDFSVNLSAPNLINRNLQLFKTIAVNSDGKDQITYSNSAGQTIATCITGDGSGCVPHKEVKKVYAGNGEKNIETIYIPKLKAGTFKMYETNGTTKYYNHFAPKLSDALTGIPLSIGTDYTYNSSNGEITFLGTYFDRSLYLSLNIDLVPSNYSMPITNNVFASVEVDYTQWTLYFYDRKGRLLGNASPNDVVCQTAPYSVQKTIQNGKKFNAAMMSSANTANTLPDSTTRMFNFALNDNALRAGTDKLEAYVGFEIKVDTIFNFNMDSTALSLFTPPYYYFDTTAVNFADTVYYTDSLLAIINHRNFNYDAKLDSLGQPYFSSPDTNLISPVNLLLNSKIRYKGYFTVHAVFPNDSIVKLDMDSIPFDYNIEALEYDSISGGVVCRAFGEGGGRELIPLPELPPPTSTITLVPHGDVTAIDGFLPEDGDDGTGGVNSPPTGGSGLLSSGVTLNGGIFIEEYVPVPIPLHLSNKYMYDEFDRLIGSESDDEGRVDYVYDQLEDKLLFTQNDKQRANGGKFNCIVYDKLGRVNSTGEYDATKGNYVFQNYDQYFKHPVSVPSGKTSVGVPALANNTWIYDDGSINEKTTVVYDNADPAFPSSAVGSTTYKQRFTAAKVSKTFNANSTTWYSYDELGRLSVSVSNSAEMGNTVNFNTYDFRGNLKLSSYGSQTLNKQILHNFFYDADERLVKTKYAFNFADLFNTNAQTSSTYNYYLHGPLKRMELGNKLQGLDYVYTINGMLKSINNPASTSTANDPGLDGYATGPNAAVSPDVFSLMLQYYSDDYKRSGSPIKSYNYNSAFAGGNISYSGLIKNVMWNTKLPAGAPTSHYNALTYEYQYDDLYQLTDAQFGTFGSFSGSSATFTQLNEYKLENLSYDKNGNIQSLKRYGTPNGTGAHILDDLTYNYSATLKNRLIKVADASTNTGGYAAEFDLPNQTNTNNYVYNEIGELIKNKQEDQGFEYNASGLTTRVYNLTNFNNIATFTYNDKGLRHSKTSYDVNGVAIKATYYSYDAGGAQMATYTKDLVTSGATIQLQDFTLYGAGRLGIYDEASQKAMYELTDHLGNTRAVVTKNTTTGLAETVSYTDYYPHGGVMPGRNYVNSLNFPFAYQGQEKDAETNLLNFELRQYDPRLGRWYNPDPMGQHHSPYLAMSNNPIMMIDPDGGRDVNGGVNIDATAGSDDINFNSPGLGQDHSWFFMNPSDRNAYQSTLGTSYEAQETQKRLTLGSIGGWTAPDGTVYHLINNKWGYYENSTYNQQDPSFRADVMRTRTVSEFINVQTINVIVHHGDKEADKGWGGKLGGHVMVNFGNNNMYGFTGGGENGHLGLTHSNDPNDWLSQVHGNYRYGDYNSITQGGKGGVFSQFSIPVKDNQFNALKKWYEDRVINNDYSWGGSKSPYPYGFGKGERCASSLFKNLRNNGVIKKGSALNYFTPGRVFRFLFKQGLYSKSFIKKGTSLGDYPDTNFYGSENQLKTN